MHLAQPDDIMHALNLCYVRSGPSSYATDAKRIRGAVNSEQLDENFPEIRKRSVIALSAVIIKTTLCRSSGVLALRSVNVRQKGVKNVGRAVESLRHADATTGTPVCGATGA